MSPHAFRDDPSLPGVCAVDDCGLPKANRRHTAVHTGPPAAGKVNPRVRAHYGTGVTPPAAHDSPTSKAAAKLALPNAGSHRHKVLLAIADADARGLTDEEMGDRTGLPGNTVRPRRSELALNGWITRSENHQGRVTRATAAGREADVWVLTPAGRELLNRPSLVSPAR